MRPSYQDRRPPGIPPSRRAMMPGMSGMGDDFNVLPEGADIDQALINSLYDIFGGFPRKNVLPYFYAFSLTAAGGNQLGAGGVARATITVSADAAFIAERIVGTSTGPYTNLIRTDSSDRQIMNMAVHSTTLVGTAQQSRPLPKPLLVAPNTTLSFDLTDVSGAGNDVWFTLWGFKVYQRQYANAG